MLRAPPAHLALGGAVVAAVACRALAQCMSRSCSTQASPCLPLGEGVLSLHGRDGSALQAWQGMPPAILAGSFNPLHEGHEALATAAARLVSRDVLFEIAVKNADKGALSEDDLHRRLQQFVSKHPVAVTRNTLYVDKARAFPGAYFVLGHDTTVRLLDPKYYPDGDVSNMLAQIDSHGCAFVCAGRHNASGDFVELDTSAVPQQFRHMFIVLPKDDFCLKISSTELRAQGRGV